MIHPFLKTFITVANAGSFTAASEQLYISTTAIMKQMNQLEEHLGVTLLTRTHQGIQLTKAGESIYNDTTKMLAYSREALERANRLQQKEQYTITIGSSLLYPAVEFLAMWNRIKNQYPQFKLKMVPFVDETDKMYTQLGKKFDIIAGVYGGNMEENMQFLQLSAYHFAIAMPFHHALSHKKTLTLKDLHGFHLMMMKRGHSAANDSIRAMIQNEHPQIILDEVGYYYDVETFNTCEETGSLLLTLDGWKNVHPSLATITLDVPQYVPYGILYAQTPNTATKKFIEIAKQIHTETM